MPREKIVTHLDRDFRPTLGFEFRHLPLVNVQRWLKLNGFWSVLSTQSFNEKPSEHGRHNSTHKTKNNGPPNVNSR